MRGQLAKLGGGNVTATALRVASGSDADGSPSEAMKKGPSNSDAHSDPHSAGAAHPTPAAVNPYRKGDKVATACKGADVEAEVTAVFKDEVQVRTPDGELRWRTVRTVKPVIVLLTSPEPADAVEPVAPRRRKRTGRVRGSKKG